MHAEKIKRQQAEKDTPAVLSQWKRQAISKIRNRSEIEI
jgi:hypothetical protein